MIARLARIIRAFGGDRRGVSAVEFALIAPFMVTLYLGGVQLSLALTADRKLTSTANAVGDLVAQDDYVTDGEMADIFAAADAIMAPYRTDPLALRVSSVRMNDDGDVWVDWSEGEGLPARDPTNAPAIPDGVLVEGESIVVVEAGYVFRTPYQIEGLEEFTLSDTVYLRPRRSLWVRREG